MVSLRQNWIQAGALIALNAVLFYAFFQFNHWLTGSLMHSESINWLFLPAGLRVILVLIMGLSGAVGIVLGSWAVGLAEGQPWSLFLLGNGLISGLTPWLVLRWIMPGRVFQPRVPMPSARRLIGFVLAYALANALFHHLFWWLTSPDAMADLRGLVPMTVGDVLGALTLLYLLKWTFDRWPVPTPGTR